MRRIFSKLKAPFWSSLLFLAGIGILLLLFMQPWRRQWITAVPGVNLNPARIPLKPEDMKSGSAWDLIRRASLEKEKIGKSANDIREKFSKETDLLHLDPWSDTAFPASVRYLELNRSTMDLIRQAVQAKEKQVPDYGGAKSPPYLFYLTDVPFLFSASAARKASSGDYGGAFADLDTAIDYADTYSRGSTLMMRLMEIGDEIIILRDMRRIALQQTIPENVAADTIRHLDAMDKTMEPWAETIRNEKRDIASEIKSTLDPGSAHFYDYPDWFAKYPRTGAFLTGSWPDRMQSDMENLFAHFIDLSAKPYDRESLMKLDAIFSSSADDWQTWAFVRDPAGYVLAGMMANALKITTLNHYLRLADLRATEVVLAIRQFEQNEKHPPPALGQLVPRYLQAIPTDPYDGKPLKYRLNVDGSWMVYSIGPNQVDDGGTQTRERLSLDVPGDITFSNTEAVDAKKKIEETEAKEKADDEARARPPRSATQKPSPSTPK